VTFALVVHDRCVGVIYEYEQLLAATRALDPSTIALRLGLDEIAALEIGPAPSPRMRFELVPAAIERVRAATLLDTAPFRLELDGESLVTGVVYTPIGAAGIRTPVLHVRAPGDKHVRALTIGAYLGAAMVERGLPGDDVLAQRIDLPALRTAFARHGKLRELDTPPSFLGGH
jgi:hypothetical protein